MFKVIFSILQLTLKPRKPLLSNTIILLQQDETQNKK